MSPIPATHPKCDSLLLVGNPNVGKSVLFGTLTGRYVNVSNYPGTTIEVTRGRARGMTTPIEIIDTPGTNHLIPMSEDERVTRDILLAEPEATVIQVGDAKNLRRTLALTLELGLMGHRVVLALNMMDEAYSRGVQIDRGRLEQRLGLPVVETVAIRRQGLRGLRRRFAQAQVPQTQIRYPALIETALTEMIPLLTGTSVSPRFLGVLILSGDRTIIPWLRRKIGPDALERCETIRLTTSRLVARPLSHLIQTSHLDAVDSLLAEHYRSGTARRAG